MLKCLSSCDDAAGAGLANRWRLPAAGMPMARAVFRESDRDVRASVLLVDNHIAVAKMAVSAPAVFGKLHANLDQAVAPFNPRPLLQSLYVCQRSHLLHTFARAHMRAAT